jgi:outer membrane lipoprotein SlyB
MIRVANHYQERLSMTKSIVLRAALALALLGGFAGQAQAVGCVSGAVVGAITGHEAHHHAILGAIGGCVAGHELAVDEKKMAKEKKLSAEQLNAQQLQQIQDQKKSQ